MICLMPCCALCNSALWLKNNNVDKRLLAFERLLNIMDELRAKCPWDKKQTFESLRYLTIEETYELSDALIDNDLKGVKEELGDILLHIVFYAKLGEEAGAFDITDVLDNINKKLVVRHPHIFGDTKVSSSEEVKENWEKIKLQEGKKSVLAGVPKSLPPLIKAERMQEKARGVGFDWDHKDQVWDKVIEELNELKYEVDNDSPKAKIEGELGDLLFAVVNYSRFIDIHPDDALERTNKKFKSRFEFLEQRATEIGKSIKDMTLAEMEAIWQESKQFEK